MIGTGIERQFRSNTTSVGWRACPPTISSRLRRLHELVEPVIFNAAARRRAAMQVEYHVGEELMSVSAAFSSPGAFSNARCLRTIRWPTRVRTCLLTCFPEPDAWYALSPKVMRLTCLSHSRVVGHKRSIVLYCADKSVRCDQARSVAPDD